MTVMCDVFLCSSALLELNDLMYWCKTLKLNWIVESKPRCTQQHSATGPTFINNDSMERWSDRITTDRIVFIIIIERTLVSANYRS